MEASEGASLIFCPTATTSFAQRKYLTCSTWKLASRGQYLISLEHLNVLNDLNDSSTRNSEITTWRVMKRVFKITAILQINSTQLQMF